LTVLVALALGISLLVSRRLAAQRMATLSVCLFGDEPLEKDEKAASRRFYAIELARPRERMKIEVSTHLLRESLVPENPLPVSERWPDRCATHATKASTSWVLSSAFREKLRDVGEELLDRKRQKPPTVVDEIWRTEYRVAFPERVDAAIPRPWPPVTFVPRGQSSLKTDLGRACPPISMLATLDHWDDESIVLAGTPGCVISAKDNASSKRLSQLRLATPADTTSSNANANADKLLGGKKAIVNGVPVSITDDERAELAPHDKAKIEIDAMANFTTCRSGPTRVILFESKAAPNLGKTFDVRFISSDGAVSESARVSSAPPEFPGHGAFGISRGTATMSCREGIPPRNESEARVAWVWSTMIEQAVTHEVFVATCVRGQPCTTKSTRLQLETVRLSNCGFCAVALNHGGVDSPIAIDLFGGIALVWTEPNNVHARIAQQLDQLQTAREIILWSTYLDDPPPVTRGYWDPPRIITRAETALVGIEIPDHGGSRLFRLDATGATELR
jgi:hypothetical protein